MTAKIFFQKITRDILISLIITYFLLLIPELVLPGIISTHISPKYVLLAILLLGWLFYLQREKSKPEETLKFSAISKSILNVILFIITIMLILSLYKMKIWQILIVVVVSISLIIAMNNILIEEKE